MQKHITRIIVLIALITTITPNILFTNATTNNFIEISSEAAILIDGETGRILYEKNAYEPNYPASITKLMTALLVMESQPNPEDIVTFSHDAIFGIERGSSHIGINVDEQLTIDQSLHALLLNSANEVANGLAEHVGGTMEDFAIMMTDRAKELGALDTNFVNAHGLHDDNHYSTPYDMALIGMELLKHDYFLQIMDTLLYDIEETNLVDETRYLRQSHRMFNPSRGQTYLREDVFGGKTGYTSRAGHTLVTMAKQGDTTLIAVVMNSESGNQYEDTNTLLDYGFENFEQLTLTSNDVNYTLPIYDPTDEGLIQIGHVNLVLEEPAKVLVNKDLDSDIISSPSLPNFVNPLVEKGDSIGTVTYLLDNNEYLGTSNLIIDEIIYTTDSPNKYTESSENVNRYFNNNSDKIKIIIMLISLVVLIISTYFYFKTPSKKNRYSYQKYKK